MTRAFTIASEHLRVYNDLHVYQYFVIYGWNPAAGTADAGF